jgi:hypothetical protein
MTPEQIGQIITAFTSIGALAGAIATYLKARTTERKVDDNTKITETIQHTTVDRLRLDELERWHAAYVSFEECDKCRARIEALKNRRRVNYPKVDV